jgi:ankyrin repeat protein
VTIEQWRVLVYGEGHRGPQPAEAQRALDAHPEFAREDPHAAGVPAFIGDLANASSGMPALAAVTHSSLSRVRPQDFAECTRKLIAMGADVNAGLALYGAAGKNHQAGIAKLLLDAGADPNDNESVYHATEERSLECLKLLLASGARAKGTNALNHSLDRDAIECTRLLLEAGADPNEGNAPPLHWAIRHRRSMEHIDALLAAGADPRLANHFGFTPFRAALLYGLPEVAAKLRKITGESISDTDAFVAACARGDRDEAARLRRPVPPVYAVMLPEAVANGNDRGARLMVEMGWPIAARGGDWNATALNLAVFRGNAAMVTFLLEHGASWEEKHGFGDNVCGTLSYASVERPHPFGNWLACARALIEVGGMPVPSLDRYRFSREIRDYFVRLSSGGALQS